MSLQVRPILPPYQQIAEQLEAAIVAGRLAPGDRLPGEQQLAADFGVSRHTVREALRLLASREVVYAVRGAQGGVFVSGSDLGAVASYLETSLGRLNSKRSVSAEELLEAREMLESRAARMAAHRRTDAHLDALAESLRADLGVPPSKRRAGVDNTFHRQILDAAGNRMITMLTVPIFRVIEGRFADERQNARTWRMIDADHTRLLDCIRDRDAEAAALAMTAHLEHLRPAYVRIDRAEPGIVP